MNITTKIYVDSSPRYAIWYKNPNGNIVFWDSTPFRPNIREELKAKRNYQGIITFEKENLPRGEIILIPSKIKVGNVTFINVR